MGMVAAQMSPADDDHTQLPDWLLRRQGPNLRQYLFYAVHGHMSIDGPVGKQTQLRRILPCKLEFSKI